VEFMKPHESAGRYKAVSSLKGLGICDANSPSTHVLGYDCSALRAFHCMPGANETDLEDAPSPLSDNIPK